ncbi:hypothetical protein, partial [Aeromonas finlandensis]|uniref:hypothetical protein n=1 Tax=Aeromonas finlandensis TaxID=1543375 RepID=UPI0019D3CD38
GVFSVLNSQYLAFVCRKRTKKPVISTISWLYQSLISFINSHLNASTGGQIRLLPLAGYRAVPY